MEVSEYAMSQRKTLRHLFELAGEAWGVSPYLAGQHIFTRAAKLPGWNENGRQTGYGWFDVREDEGGSWFGLEESLRPVSAALSADSRESALSSWEEGLDSVWKEKHEGLESLLRHCDEVREIMS